MSVACHITTRPIDRSKLVAPPAMGITNLCYGDVFSSFIV